MSLGSLFGKAISAASRVARPAASPDEAALTGLWSERPRVEVIDALVGRSRARLAAMAPAARTRLLEDTLYWERLRLEKARPTEEEHARIDNLAHALVRGGDDERLGAALALVRAWSDEIHGRFDPRAYRLASHVLPRGLGALLSPRPEHLRDWRPNIEGRLSVEGPTDLIRELAREATLMLTPTHVSNLDSPVIGLALQRANLPPFVYGAGLNLFSNPVMGGWMSRLGAYTVDRTKRAELYKETLKDYSVDRLTTRHHSLFFPGGTRARSGLVETRIKKGLLGTGLSAWQEMIRAGRTDAEIYVVPMTLSFPLVLEASTLIDDHLAEVGKQRYIIDDDESTQAGTTFRFVERLLALDAPLVVHFGAPMDLLGRPVSADARVRAQQARERRGYVCDRSGAVEIDAQRDHVYTERLSRAIVESYPSLSHALSTHAAAFAAWDRLGTRAGTRDPFRLVRIPREARRFQREELVAAVGRVRDALARAARAERCQLGLPDDPALVLREAIERFGNFHRTNALEVDGDEIVIGDPKLLLYYRNRLAHALEDGCA
jgi:glycerol-3-phosphate O-acyltransferase